MKLLKNVHIKNVLRGATSLFIALWILTIGMPKLDRLVFAQSATAIPIANLLTNPDFGSWSQSDTNQGLGTLAYDAGDINGAAVPAVGDVVTGADSSATGKIISYTTATGAWATADGAGVLTIGACNGCFADNEVLTFTAGAVAVANKPAGGGNYGDLVNNGDFTTATTGWTLSNATLSAEAGGLVGNCLKVLDGGAGNGYGYQQVTTVVGKLYKFTAWAKDIDTGQDGLIEVGTAAGGAQYYSSGTITSDAGASYTVEFEATTTTTFITLNATTAGGTYYFDSVSLYEITPCATAANNVALDGWQKDSTFDIYRQHNDGGTYTKDGSFYALKMVPTVADDYIYCPRDIYLSAEWYQRFAGRTVTVGIWAKTSTASHFRYDVGDGSSHYSSYHTGGGGWEWIETSITVNASPSSFAVSFRAEAAPNVDGSTIVYVSQPILVFGSSIGSGNFSRPPQEVIRFEKDVVLTGYDLTAGGISGDLDQILNLEALSSGKIPKGVAEIYANVRAMDSAVASNVGVWIGPDTTYTASGIGDIGIYLEGLGNDVLGQAGGWVRCSSAGDAWIFLNASGANTLDCEIRVTGIRMR